jgi:hypothetical protein
MQQEIEFYERQTLPLWVKIVISGIFLVSLIFMLVDVPENKLALILTSILFIGLLVFIWTVTLKTIINSDGIHVKVFPMFKFKTYAWENISNIEIKKQVLAGVSPLHLGFGLRFRIGLNFFRGTVTNYNFAGKYHIQFVWKGFRKIRISTNQPVEMEEILEKLGKINQQADI